MSSERTIPASFWFSWQYVKADLTRNSRSFRIGVFTIALSVIAMAVIQSVVDRVGLVFMRLAELNVGENDMVMRPSGSANLLLNSTWIEEQLRELDAVTGACPRWAIPAYAVSRTNTNLSAEVYLFVVDSALEKEIGLGRTFAPRVLNEQEAYISSGVLDYLGVKGDIGDRIYLELNITQLTNSYGLDLSALTNATSFNRTQILENVLGINPDQDYTIDLNSEAAVDQIRDFLIRNNVTFNETQLDQLNTTTEVTVTGSQLVSLINSPQIDEFISRLSNQTLNNLRVEAIALASVQSPRGKWPSLMGNVAVMDIKYLKALINNLLYNTPELRLLQSVLDLSLLGGTTIIPTTFSNYTDHPNDYAFTVTVQYKDRLKAYQKGPEAMKRDIIQFANEVYTTLGLDFDAENYVPIVSFINPIISVLFKQSFILIDAMIVILSCLLIYNLMLDNISEKVYEYGMLRALGLLKKDLMKILLVHAFVYAIPGTLIGILVGMLVFLIFSYFIAKQAAVDFPSDVPFTASGAVIGICLGILLPLVSNLLLIRTALSNTLRDALDITHHTFNDTKVRMIRLEKLGLSPREISFGLSCFVIGFVSYYLFPYALLYTLYDLAFGILTVVIVGMVLGLAAISMALQPAIENVLVYVFVQFEDRPLRSLIEKNLGAHRKRNHKTATIFTLSLAFIVFGTALRENQQHMIFDSIRVGYGSDIRITTSTTTTPLNRQELIQILEKDKTLGKRSVVEDYSFATYPMRQTDTVTESFERNLGDYPDASVELIGVEKNLLNVLNLEFLSISSTDSGTNFKKVRGHPDVIASLFDKSSENTWTSNAYVTAPAQGLQQDSGNYHQPSLSEVQAVIEKANVEYVTAVASESVRKYIASSTHAFHKVTNKARRVSAVTNVAQKRSTLVKSKAFLNKLPGFSFSSYQTSVLLGFTSLLISVDNYEMILKNMQNASMSAEPGFVIREEVAFRDLFIRVRSNAEKSDVNFLVDSLKSSITSSNIRVLVLQDMLDNLDSFINFVDYLFSLVVAVAMVLCFFSLFLSVFGNVKENSWEYGVLRALGLSIHQLYRVYLYEAFCVIFAAMLTGTVTGLIISILLAKFTIIWTEFPLVLRFNSTAYWLVICLSCLIAIVATFIPLNKLNQCDIANVLRGGDIEPPKPFAPQKEPWWRKWFAVLF
eukprot:c7092_g1_i2.p1 GENE.c7092_g1_i2~~c7092_g1_i2.p1  ORF type:complete len:1174 (+),score=290.24 c7092_g1_i2:181-3702(+)